MVTRSIRLGDLPVDYERCREAAEMYSVPPRSPEPTPAQQRHEADDRENDDHDPEQTHRLPLSSPGASLFIPVGVGSNPPAIRLTSTGYPQRLEEQS
jgi:hypothetical protein